MKKTYIIFVILFLTILLVGCKNDISTNVETIIKTKIVEDTSKIDELEAEIEKYKSLLSNLNELLGNVYYGYASNENWESDGFTAFSLKYKGKYYIITAGHAVHYKDDKIDTGLYTTIKFKQGSGDWIYPELLAYENDFDNYRDYAIFYSNKVDSGLEYDINEIKPTYILGSSNNNIFSRTNRDLVEGESGSPIIDLEGEVIGIAIGAATGSYTPIYIDIDLVLEAIDNLE